MNVGTQSVSNTLAILIFLLGAGISFSQEISPPGHNNQVDRALPKIFEEFLNQIEQYVSDPEKTEGVLSISEGRRFVAPTTGRTVEVGGAHFLGHVSESQGAVTFLLNRLGFPESHPVIGENGVVVPPSVLQGRTVRIELAEAEKIATDIRDSVIGNAISSKLCKSDGELVYRGSYFVYEFSWVECIDVSGQADFMSRISIVVNPENGDLISFMNQTSVPAKKPGSSTIERLDLAIRSHVGDQPYTVIRKVPFRFWSEDGTSEDRCVVQYYFGPTMTNSVNTMVVSLRDFRVISTKNNSISSGVWDPSQVCP